MNPKKKNLIQKLQIAIHGLETDSVKYNWYNPCSCNCGIVAQSMLGMSMAELDKRIQVPFSSKNLRQYLIINQNDSLECSWRNAVKAYCPMTGKPLDEIFSQLNEAGLSREDMCHLEYMTNPLILKKANIETTRMQDSLFGRLFKIYEPYSYYKQADNLIKYLSAWVEILKEETAPDSDLDKSIDELRSIEINAVAEDNFELAIKVRDKISSIKV